MTYLRFKCKLSALLIATLCAMPSHSLPEVPVFLKEPVPPNILLTLDDSGSMASGFVPDAVLNLSNTNRFLAASFNPIQYNPANIYRLPPKADGSTYSTSFTAAWLDGFLRLNPKPIDLSTSYQPSRRYFTGNEEPSEVIGKPQPAYYFVYDTSIKTCITPDRDSDSCYRKVIVGAAERQNFANWYSFYRTRNLTLRSALLIALNEIDPQLRFGWQALNTCQGGWGGNTCEDALGNVVANGMNPLTLGSHRSNLFNWVAGLSTKTYTPLQQAFARAGEYFSRTGRNSPYRDIPGTLSAQNACRLSYHVALTDGLWNDDPATVRSSESDTGGGSLPDGVSYVPMAPFASTSDDNIADFAFSHWRKDLQPGMANTAPPFSTSGNTTAPNTWPSSEYWNPRNDPATWQHLVTYTVGLGLAKSLNDPKWVGGTYASNASGDGYAKFESGAAPWPPTGANVDPGNVYDLWHAAINGRGEFFAAETPDEVYRAFQSILARITALSGSAGNVATASAYVFSNSLAYQSTFSSTNWSGTVTARTIDRFGRISAEKWSTDDTLANVDYSSRNLFTRALKTAANPVPAVIPFKWSNMDTVTQEAFRSEDIVRWLAGDQSLEQGNPACSSGCIYRRRTKLLGDVLGSSTIIVSDQDFGYQTAQWVGGGETYRAYLAAKAKRPPVVLVGANDGFVHGFNGNTGRELFGYAPGEVISKMWRLTEPVYVKKAFVDGPIAFGDAYLDGRWGTFAVGAMGAGAKSVYALNVTDPENFSARSVLWEFTHPKLGHVLSKPLIVRLPSGTWAAIFSGGYENDNNSAALFTVNLQSGELIAVLPLARSVNACGVTPPATTKNGLGAPRAFYGKDGEFYIYAGDLWGHLWRFEFSTAQSRMIVSFSGDPMFKACGANSVAQPITAQPTVTSLGAAPFVYFGTGRLFDAGDTALTTVNSFYGVIDDGVAHTANRTTLLTQQSVTALSATARSVSDLAVNLVAKRGWFFDLPASGERVLAPAVNLNERLVFNTLVPATVACESKGTSWLFEVDALSGAAFPSATLDVNGDGQFSAADKVNGKSVAAIAIDATVSGVTAIRTVNTLQPGGRQPPTGGCRPGDIKLITANVYSSETQQHCTPGATLRTGWRQIR
jgi:type IV pilus assembly protein PilY1